MTTLVINMTILWRAEPRRLQQTTTQYTECWPCPLFDILLNKYYPAGQTSGRQETTGVLLVKISRECTPSPTLGTSNLLQPAQAEVMLGQLSTYLASWRTMYLARRVQRVPCTVNSLACIYSAMYSVRNSTVSAAVLTATVVHSITYQI